MRLGHQTYSWEMQRDTWRGTPDDILDTVAAAGYQGVEFSNLMIGDYWDRPDYFRKGDWHAGACVRGICLFGNRVHGSRRL